MRVRSLAMFWALAVLVTWGAGTIVALSTQGSFVNGVNVRSGALPLTVCLALVLSASGPAVAAVIVSATETGLGGVRALLSQGLRWRAGVRWYAVALLLPTLLTMLATVIWAVATGGRPDRWFPLPTAFQLLGLPIFPWGEEIGWRGFAQPRLLAGLHWLPASIIVGVMWGLWHQWLLLTPRQWPESRRHRRVLRVHRQRRRPHAWAYNGGGRRLPLGWAGHAGLNAVGPTSAPFGLVAGMFASAAVVVGMLGGRRKER